MHKHLLTAVFTGILFLTASAAHAVVVFDTGTPTARLGAGVYNQASNNLQFVAGQFNLTENYLLNSLEGFFNPSATTADGSIDAVVYFDNAGTVDPVGELFRSSFILPSSSSTSESGWYGATGLNLALSSGTYWLAFEAPNVGNVSTIMPGGSVNPLLAYALNQGAGWQPLGVTAGMRAEGTIENAHIPEPASMLLIGTGLIGAALRRRKIRS